eukprot:3742859-Rhodomonas_salina.1
MAKPRACSRVPLRDLVDFQRGFAICKHGAHSAYHECKHVGQEGVAWAPISSKTWVADWVTLRLEQPARQDCPSTLAAMPVGANGACFKSPVLLKSVVR